MPTLTKPRPTAEDKEKAHRLLADFLYVTIRPNDLHRASGDVADLRDRIAEALAEARAERGADRP